MWMTERLWEWKTMKERQILWERVRTSVVREVRKEKERETEKATERLYQCFCDRESEKERVTQSEHECVRERLYVWYLMQERDTHTLTQIDRVRL